MRVFRVSKIAISFRTFDPQLFEIEGPNMSRMVSTGVLSGDLGITDRRVQQLVADFVLPPPRDGKHDRDLCAERFAIYREPEGREFDRLQADAQADAGRIERLVEAACAAGSTPEEVQAASRAHHDAMATLRFIAVVTFRSNEAAKVYALKDIERMDEEATGALLHRSMEIMAERSGMTVEQVQAKIEADCLALERRRHARAR